MSSNQEILAKIRTLLAIERNYLSEERTSLAEFRTGLTIALVSLPAVSLVHYFFESIPNTNPLFAVLLYLSFAILTVIGIWISMKSRLKLKKIQQKIRLLKDRQLKVMKDSDELCNLLEDCIAS